MGHNSLASIPGLWQEAATMCGRGETVDAADFDHWSARGEIRGVEPLKLGEG